MVISESQWVKVHLRCATFIGLLQTLRLTCRLKVLCDGHVFLDAYDAL